MKKIIPLYIIINRRVFIILSIIVVNLTGTIRIADSTKNLCESNPCENSGTCGTNGKGQITCQCPSGFVGPYCQYNNPCNPSQCQNGGSCQAYFPNDTSPPLFNCSCPIGYTASLCEVQISTICDNSPCKNGGTCKVKSTAKNSAEEFTCVCPVGFSGTFCEVGRTAVAERCENGRDCNKNGSGSKNFGGDVSECNENVCKNGGRCVSGRNGNFTCQCPPNWKGPQCTVDVDECVEQPNVCQNAGTCNNFIGGFRCICVNGWVGENCEINDDDCVGTKCYNGGTCHDLVGTFRCECAPGYTGLICHLRDACMSSPCHASAICDTNPMDGSYVCSCPQGYRGVDCSEDIDECSLGNPCEHAGTCYNTPGSYKCLCALGWTGMFCDQNINECALNPCQNDATCLDDVGKFICVCMPGFSGVHCEINIDDCASTPCQNGGICVDGTNNYTCHCLNGFYGHYCEHSSIKPKLCDARPCKNNGECIELSGHYLCRCIDGFYGVHCERSAKDKPSTSSTTTTTTISTAVKSTTATYRRKLDKEYSPIDEVITYEEVDKINLAQCLANQCAKKANNGICEPECNYPICGYDGLDCSAGLDPFSGCPRKDYCPHVFKDGKCDDVCNVESCLFDGLDCIDKTDLTCNPLYETYCIRHLGDGNCDSGCNTRGCNYDGGDCSDKNKRTLLVGAVALVLTVEPEIFVNQSNVFLMALGKILDVNLKIKLDDQNRPMIYRWNSRDGVESRDPIILTSGAIAPSGPQKFTSSISQTKDSPYFSGVFVVLIVDITKCTLEGRPDCFSKVESVANFLGASRAREALKQELGWDIYSATPETDATSSTLSRNVWLISIGSLLVLIFFSLVVAERKRKIVSKLWRVPSTYVDACTTNRQFPLCRGSVVDKNGNFAVPQNLYESDLMKKSSNNNNGCLNHVTGGNLHNARCNQSYSHLDEYINSCHRDLDQYSESGTYSTYAADSDACSLQVLPNGAKRFKPSTTEASGYYAVTVKNEPGTVTVANNVDEWSQEHKNIAAGYISPRFLSSVNTKGPDNQTALMIAACAKYDTDESLKILEQVISGGADLNVQTETNGETALILGVRCCRVQAVKVMLQRGGDPNLSDARGNSALHHAVNVNSAEMVNSILRDSRCTVDVEAKNDDGCTSLILAAKLASGSTAVLELLLLYKASTCAQDNDGKTALHWAAVQNDVEAVTCLLNHGANKDATDFNDQTPLSLAVRENHVETTLVLLERGASKDMVDSVERSPLQIAEERGYVELAKLLKKFQYSANFATGKAHSTVISTDSLLQGSLTLRHATGAGGHGHNKPRPPRRTKSLKETGSTGHVGARKSAQPPPPPLPVLPPFTASLDCCEDDDVTMDRLNMAAMMHDDSSPPLSKPSRQQKQHQQQKRQQQQNNKKCETGFGGGRHKNGSVSGNSPLSSGSSYASSSGVPSVEHVSSFDGSPALSMESPPFFGGTPSPAAAWYPPAMYTISCQFPSNVSQQPTQNQSQAHSSQQQSHSSSNNNVQQNVSTSPTTGKPTLLTSSTNGNSTLMASSNQTPALITSPNSGNWYPTAVVPSAPNNNNNVSSVAWYHAGGGYTHYTTPKDSLGYAYVETNSPPTLKNMSMTYNHQQHLNNGFALPAADTTVYCGD